MRERAIRGAAALLIVVGTMWIVRAIDSFDADGVSVVGYGVIPRTQTGLFGILVAPLVHADWNHLIANTAPLLVLSILILLRGVDDYAFVILVTMLVSGTGCWLFGAGATQHVGASGVVLGMMSFLFFRSLYDRRLSSFIIAVAVAIAYAGTALFALVPQPWFSWSMHFFGLVGGAIAARWRYVR